MFSENSLRNLHPGLEAEKEIDSGSTSIFHDIHLDIFRSVAECKWLQIKSMCHEQYICPCGYVKEVKDMNNVCAFKMSTQNVELEIGKERDWVVSVEW